jgi:predicted transglutaminase-like cysteine proteinase
MLDNMSRLGKIIESGQELDNALIDILNQQQKLNKKLGDMVTLEEYKAYTVQNDFRLGASKHDDDDQYDLIEELSADLDKINNNFNKKIKKIEVGLADIKSDLNKIKNSKMGSKLLGD